MWGHVVLHATTLFRLRPTLLNTQIPLELHSGRPPNASHPRVFGCQVWVPIPEPQRLTISTHRQEGIYLDFDSPSIIRYLIPDTGIILKTRFATCKFIETQFPKLPSTLSSPPITFTTLQILTSNPDPCTSLAKTEASKLLHLQALAKKIPDGLCSGPRIIHNPIPSTGNSLPETRATPKQITPRTPRHRPHSPIFTSTTLATDLIDTPLSMYVDPTSLGQARDSLDWLHWNDTLEAECVSLHKHHVFGSLSTSLPKPPIGYKLIFTMKCDEHGNVLQFKA